MATVGGVPGGVSALVAIGVTAGKALVSAVKPVAQQLPFGGLDSFMSTLVNAGQWIGAAMLAAGVALGISRGRKRAP
jgi:hypothetical protein